jgi:hypothetical protein
VSHSYKQRVFEFFGFGPEFINLINTLCINRSACIVFEDGSLSDNFDLERGDAQGNTPSPVLYNMAQQIFLFKLELCPEIRSVFVNHLVPRPISFQEELEEEGVPREEFVPEDEFSNECNRETDKGEGFADDTSGLSLFELESLKTLKQAMLDFGEFSGLKCNVEKTVLMQIGNIQPPSQEIIDLGFTFVESIHLLGMEIDRDLLHLDNNFLAVHNKIVNSVAYWSRYNLSLPGRINVIKSLMISLINYLGCFLMPKPATVNKIQKVLDDFAIGKLNVARNRICLPPDCGGLGLFRIDEFLASQQCTWILKADRSIRDNWRCDLFNITKGNCLNLSPSLVNYTSHPILYGLAVAFEKLRVCHDSNNENFLKATFMNHPMFFREAGNKLPLSFEYLECEKDILTCYHLGKLTMEHLYGHNGLITRAELRLLWGVDLSLTGYANLGKSLNHFVNRLSINRLNDGTTVGLREDLSIKNPGKKIRKKMLKRRKKPFNLETQQTCKSFFKITGMQYIGNDTFSKIVAMWNISGFTNREKTFIFKFYNNILGLNTRTSHFAANPNRGCFFCSKMTPPVTTDETFLHLFLICPTTKKWHDQFMSTYLPNLLLNDGNLEKNFWFLGLAGENFNLFLCSAVLTFQFCIWEQKLKKTVPSFHGLKMNFISLFRDTVKFNGDITKSGLLLNYDLCRFFLGDGRERQVQDE